jgi:hypothetical protein
MAQTVLERLQARARREAWLIGFLEGWQIGFQEGRREAWQAALIRVLRSRFADLPESVVERIRLLEDIARLEDLVGRAATAGSLEEMERLLSG